MAIKKEIIPDESKRKILTALKYLILNKKS